MSDMSPLLGAERTQRRHLISAAIDPNVWSGRAWQEEFDELVVSGLASMYQTSDWSLAPGHYGYQRACELISGKASIGPNGSPVFACAGKTEPPSRLILDREDNAGMRLLTAAIGMTVKGTKV